MLQMSVELVSTQVEAVSRLLFSIATPLVALYLLKVTTVCVQGSEVENSTLLDVGC